MKAQILAIALMLPSPALACHKYSHWYYPWPQSCRDNKMVAMYEPKLKLKEPPIRTYQPDPIISPVEILNNEMDNLAQLRPPIPDVDIGALLDIISEKSLRERALGKIKNQLH
jgi:hypothetical protein